MGRSVNYWELTLDFQYSFSELSDAYLKLIMEKGNRDLASILNSARGKNAKPISPFTIQHYWQGMLLAVQAIHQEG